MTLATTDQQFKQVNERVDLLQMRLEALVQKVSAIKGAETFALPPGFFSPGVLEAGEEQRQEFRERLIRDLAVAALRSAMMEVEPVKFGEYIVKVADALILASTSIPPTEDRTDFGARAALRSLREKAQAVADLFFRDNEGCSGSLLYRTSCQPEAAAEVVNALRAELRKS